MSAQALRHLEHLAGVIGPRGSCTPQERQASEYCFRVLRELGYEPQMVEFRAPRSGWASYSIGSGLMLLAVALSVLQPGPAARAAAALVALAVTASTFLQLLFRANPLAWLVPTGRSQNVYAVAPPRRKPDGKPDGKPEQGGRRRTVVVVGHVDTHRTPVAMASPLAFRMFQGLTTAGVVAFVVLTAALGVAWLRPDLASAWLQPGGVLRPLLATVAVVIAVVFAVTLQPEFSRFVPGANDNASGAAAALALAERLRARPLEHTEVWLLNSGAEEVGAAGPIHLLRAHPELRDADWLVLDTIAGPRTGPCLITAEHLLVPLRAHPALLDAARVVAAARPELGVYEHYYRGLFSEHSPLVVAGCRSLAVINFTRDGVLPHWHRPTDTVANIDPEVLDRTEAFAWALLEALDRQAGAIRRTDLV